MSRVDTNAFSDAVEKYINEKDKVHRNSVFAYGRTVDPAEGLDPEQIQCIDSSDVISYSELLRRKKKTSFVYVVNR